jgi:hypothetical protein
MEAADSYFLCFCCSAAQLHHLKYGAPDPDGEEDEEVGAHAAVPLPAELRSMAYTAVWQSAQSIWGSVACVLAVPKHAAAELW